MCIKLALVVDLDDTLVYTQNLNNDAYNYALSRYKCERIKENFRITSRDLNDKNIKNIDAIKFKKQNYFLLDWMPYRTFLNNDLLEYIKSIGKDNCFLWTAADRNRALKIVSFYGLDNYFSTIIFDDKINIKRSFSTIKNISNCNIALVLDDNAENIMKNVENYITFVGKLTSKKFLVYAWLVNMQQL